jgi:hypothetical protein
MGRKISKEYEGHSNGGLKLAAVVGWFKSFESRSIKGSSSKKQTHPY